jgi:hypothetical protein
VAGAAATAAGVIGAGPAYANGKDGGGDLDGDLLLTNGRVHTMDAHNRTAEAVLISNGRIAAVGSTSSIRKGLGNKVRTVDLKGRTVIPGIIDSHTHIVLVGNRPGWHTPLEDVFTIPGVVKRYQQRVAGGVPAGEFVTTIGPVAAMQFPEQRLPNLTELDAVPRPVYIQGAAGGVWTNSLGREWFTARGVTVNPDGSIPGGATGSTLALQLLRSTFLTPATRKRGARDALDYYAGLGITTHLDQGAFQADTPSGSVANENNFTMYNPFLDVHADGDLPARMRVNFLYMDQDPDSVALSNRLANAFPFFGDDMLRTGAIGEFFAPDPSDPIGSGSAANLRWLEAGMKVAQAGWRAENHSLSATDFKAEIDGFGLINAQHPITDLRWVVAHVPFITEDYVQKLKTLGGGLKVGWGPIRTGTNLGPPYRMILDSGIHVGYHADGGDVTLINPWLNFYTMITAKNLHGDLINDGNQLTRQETLWLATAANKWFIGEDDLGSIEVGNHADLAVLDRDYFSVAAEDIKHISADLTIVGGEVTHNSGAIRF